MLFYIAMTYQGGNVDVHFVSRFLSQSPNRTNSSYKLLKYIPATAVAQHIYYVIIDTVYIYLIDCRNSFYLPQLNVRKLLKVA